MRGNTRPQVWLRRTLFYAAIIVLLWGSCGQCCGPGRGGGRRRSPRKLTPLVFKQHVPNVGETTLGASGLTEGRIARDDPRFHDLLVPNYNVDILFSDEEGTGADRLMTERCKEKLNTLAISVMNQWPGVRLRVVEAWDEGSLHAPNSLHYEGRAVDIATSDKDVSKHGMLARLAVQAGFDWVYYESRSRIHCSVKSESTSRRKLGGCFPGRALVETPSGVVPLGSLKEGERVKVLREDGTTAFSPVLMFLHKDASSVRHFLSLVTSSGASLDLTPSHLVFVLREDAALRGLLPPTVHDALRLGEVVLAGRVTAGSYLLVSRNESGVTLEKVTDITSVRGKGIYAPLTAEGTLVVDGVVASCYAVIDSQRIAHWAFLPIRIYYSVKDRVVRGLQSLGLISRDTRAHNEQTFHPNEIQMSFASEQTSFSANKNLTTKHWNSYRKNSTSKSEIIHWYPKVLYAIASWLLPSHLVLYTANNNKYI